MPKRFTDSEKWKDPWFRKLPQLSKLLFLYLCDECDIAGFWEIDLDRAAFDIGSTSKALVTAMEPLQSRYETNGIHLWLRKFIRFQGNYPLNPKVPAHKGIVKLLTGRKEFSEEIPMMLEGKELPNSYGSVKGGLFNPQGQGIGKGKGQGKSKGQGKEEDYSSDFEEFWAIFKEINRAEGKPSAWDHWNATLKGRKGPTGHPPIPASAIIISARNYRDYCIADNTERKYVMLPASFVGPKRRGWEGYMEPIELVKTSQQEHDERDERDRKWAEEE